MCSKQTLRHFIYIDIIFRLLNESLLPLGNTPRPRNYWWKVSDPTRLVTIWEKPRDLRNCRCHFSVSFTNSPRSLFREPLGKFRLAPIAWPIPAGQLQLQSKMPAFFNLHDDDRLNHFSFLPSVHAWEKKIQFALLFRQKFLNCCCIARISLSRRF